MRIGEVARQVRVSTSIIRHYERNGLLPPACRDALGYRDYSEADFERIKLVMGARDLGISIADIKEILATYDQGQTPSRRILELLGHKASEVEQRSRRLESVKLELCRLRDAALQLGQFDLAGAGSAQHEMVG